MSVIIDTIVILLFIWGLLWLSYNLDRTKKEIDKIVDNKKDDRQSQ